MKKTSLKTSAFLKTFRGVPAWALTPGMAPKVFRARDHQLRLLSSSVYFIGSIGFVSVLYATGMISWGLAIGLGLVFLVAFSFMTQEVLDEIQLDEAEAGEYSNWKIFLSLRGVPGFSSYKTPEDFKMGCRILLTALAAQPEGYLRRPFHQRYAIMRELGFVDVSKDQIEELARAIVSA
ncbi:MAG: hypothetical protein WC763_04490 [Candidatus Paceibacterota bacterium]|jgi:hypothetical protein